MPLFLFFVFLCFTCRAQENIDPSQSPVYPSAVCFHTANTDLLVLGTFGAGHAKNPQFSWLYFDKLLQQIAPDMLLVQIRPEHFNKKEYFDGAPEMAYLARIAGNMKIECRGIDFWLDAQLVRWELVSPEARMAQIYKNIRTAMTSTHAKMIVLAIDTSLVALLSKCLIENGFREWACPPDEIFITSYPDLPLEILDYFKDGVAYLANLPYGGAAPTQRKIKDLNAIIRGKGYLFKR
jgi:hypothetical protein